MIINFLSDTFGSYSGGLTAPLIVDIVGKKEFGEAEGFSNGMNEVINTVAQFVGSGLLLFLSFANLAFINALTFLVAGLLFLSVGLKHRKDQKPLEAQEVNDQKFFATMKSSYKQMKKAQGLLTVIFVIALVNGMLTALGSLIPIVIAGNKATMVITSYSFTIAVMGVVVSCGAILGSMFGPQLFKKASVFTMTIIAIILSFATIIAAVFANMYAILVAYFFLAATASIASIKMQQWLVNTIEHKILASSVGLLNTILMAVAPIFTTVLTSISGFASVKYALFALIAVEVIIFFVAIKMGAKTREKKTVNATAVVTK